MSATRLTERQIEILQALREKRSGRDKELLDQVLNGSLPRGDIEPVIDLISEEFVLKGLKADYEPNNYGLELEHLLDAVNRPRLQ